MSFQLVSRLDDRQVADLHRLYQNEWWTRGRTLAEVATMLTHANFVFGLSEPVSGRLVAFARVLTDRVFKALIFDLIVAPDWRGDDLGMVLLDAILDHPELRGVAHVELYCLPELEAYYQRRGFTPETGGVRLLRRVRGVPGG